MVTAPDCVSATNPRMLPLALSILGAIALLFLCPTDALAWTPGTHILLGESLLKSADLLLPTAIAQVIRAFPYDFLYGSIAADTSFAKRYAKVGQHCHNWNVADDILGRARDDAHGASLHFDVLSRGDDGITEERGERIRGSSWGGGK